MDLEWMVVVKLILIDIVFKLNFVPTDVFVTPQFCFGDTWHKYGRKWHSTRSNPMGNCTGCSAEAWIVCMQLRNAGRKGFHLCIQYCLKLFVNLQQFSQGENSDLICGLTEVKSCLYTATESCAFTRVALMQGRL